MRYNQIIVNYMYAFFQLAKCLNACSEKKRRENLSNCLAKMDFFTFDWADRSKKLYRKSLSLIFRSIWTKKELSLPNRNKLFLCYTMISRAIEIECKWKIACNHSQMKNWVFFLSFRSKILIFFQLGKTFVILQNQRIVWRHNKTSSMNWTYFASVNLHENQQFNIKRVQSSLITSVNIKIKVTPQRVVRIQKHPSQMN